jgi:hypothetical protein
MKAWSAALGAEIKEWPRTVARSFFGFNALYRGGQIFGMLPRTRSLGNGNLLAFRIDDLSDRRKVRLQKDPRIGVIDQKNSRWFTLELSCDADLNEALDWLGMAHEAVSKRRKSE